MGDCYNHLTRKDRAFIRIMLDKHYSKAKIAQILGVHKSTIYREIERNSWIHPCSKTKHYTPGTAQNNYMKRRKRQLFLNKNAKLRAYVISKLLKGWSPWQIEGRLRLKNAGRCVVSHESIYRYIYSSSRIRNKVFKKLRRKHFTRVKRHVRKSKIPHEYLIDARPSHIKERVDFGHWECDLMLFKKGTKQNLITLRERVSRFVIILKNANKTASGTAMGLISSLTHIRQWVKSITFDQGSEFFKYPLIKDCLGSQTYFCHPGSPYEKGGVENVNGVIRAELPRSYDICTLSQKNVLELAEEINGRPLRCLNYRTPAEIFAMHTGG